MWSLLFFWLLNSVYKNSKEKWTFSIFASFVSSFHAPRPATAVPTAAAKCGYVTATDTWDRWERCHMWLSVFLSTKKEKNKNITSHTFSWFEMSHVMVPFLQVCLLNIKDEPTVEACIAVCSARIICIAAVPGLKGRSVCVSQPLITATALTKCW